MPRLAYPALLIAGLLLNGTVLAGAVVADDDQDRARAAVEKGEIRPLGEVLAVVGKVVPGEVVKLELKRDDGLWVYEFKVLTPNGRRREVEIDAKSLRVLENEDDDDD